MPSARGAIRRLVRGNLQEIPRMKNCQNSEVNEPKGTGSGLTVRNPGSLLIVVMAPLCIVFNKGGVWNFVRIHYISGCAC